VKGESHNNKKKVIIQQKFGNVCIASDFFNYLENHNIHGKVYWTYDVFRFSLQLLFETFFILIYIYHVAHMQKTHAGLHENLLLKLPEGYINLNNFFELS
jgi:hypothetical protein